MDFQDNIELRVLLLAIYKKEENESFQDILKTMENSRVFDIKTGKQLLQKLKTMNFINENSLTFLGFGFTLNE